MIAQNFLGVKKDGIAFASIGQEFVNENDFLPIREFSNKNMYHWSIDKSPVFFLRQEVINDKPFLNAVEDLFVNVGKDNRINAINVFLNTGIDELIALFSQELGKCNLVSTSGIPAYNHTKTYFWVLESKIVFSLSVVTKFEGNIINEINLLIYSQEFTDTPGELLIMRKDR